MSEFDMTAARSELDAIRKRARELEAQMIGELRRELRQTSFALCKVRDLEVMVEDVRRILDAGV